MALSKDNRTVLIVGAGPTGLALAISLAQAGVDHVLIDKLDAGQNTSRAAVVHAHTLEALDDLGVAQPLADAGLKLQHFSLRDRDRTLVRLRFDALPVIAEALALVQAGTATGASARNWASYGDSIDLAADAPEWQRKLITDPQTSGGLLVACAPNAVDAVQSAICAEQGVPGTVIGTMAAGAVRVQVA